MLMKKAWRLSAYFPNSSRSNYVVHGLLLSVVAHPVSHSMHAHCGADTNAGRFTSSHAAKFSLPRQHTGLFIAVASAICELIQVVGNCVVLSCGQRRRVSSHVDMQVLQGAPVLLVRVDSHIPRVGGSERTQVTSHDVRTSQLSTHRCMTAKSMLGSCVLVRKSCPSVPAHLRDSSDSLSALACVAVPHGLMTWAPGLLLNLHSCHLKCS
jgi:hypothetical protein